MTHACECHSTSALNEEPTKTSRPMHADRRVGEIAGEYPGALEVMNDFGINHCCGAGLTLAEAAASAGVALDRLLSALNERARTAS